MRKSASGRSASHGSDSWKQPPMWLVQAEGPDLRPDRPDHQGTQAQEKEVGQDIEENGYMVVLLVGFGVGVW
jgi:hypothetical protein